MMMIISPKYKVSEVINRIKAQTASRLGKKFPGYPSYIKKKKSFGHQDAFNLL